MAPVQSPRSKRLIDRDSSVLLVVDLQTRLAPLIPESTGIVWNASRLMRAANLLDVKTVCTEQYPERLGPTVPELAELLPETQSKRMFSCRECGTHDSNALATFQETAAKQLLVLGIETHVCVLQTVMDFLQHGAVFVVADAVGSRHQSDHSIALDRMQQAGAALTTTESVLFEWCETSLHPQFKSISALVQESPPA